MFALCITTIAVCGAFFLVAGVAIITGDGEERALGAAVALAMALAITTLSLMIAYKF